VRKTTKHKNQKIWSPGWKLNLLTCGAKPFLRSRQLCSYSRISQHFMAFTGCCSLYCRILLFHKNWKQHFDSLMQQYDDNRWTIVICHVKLVRFTYCHVMNWLRTSFGLLIGFIAYNSLLHFTYHYQTPGLLSLLQSSLPLLGSGFQRRTFHFLQVRELPPASATSF
jgi:hypothetical protein